MTLQLTSSMPGVTFSGNTLVCPPMLITTSSGENLAACEFTISSTGAVAPSSLAVTMTVSGITPAQAAANKFAIAPQPGPLAYFGTTSQTIYTLTGAQLPATVNPGVVWGANAGSELDNSDLGATIVVTYTVVAESLEGATGGSGRDKDPCRVRRRRHGRSGSDVHTASDRFRERPIEQRLDPAVRLADLLPPGPDRPGCGPGSAPDDAPLSDSPDADREPRGASRET